MFKCISKTSFEELDQSNRRLYQFFFLSLLLYRNVLEIITEENRRYPDVSLVDLDWATQLDIPELDKFSDKQLKHPKGTVGVCPQVRELLQKKYRQFEQEPPKMSADLAANIKTLKNLFGLNDAEQTILVFLALMESSSYNIFNLLEALHNRAYRTSSFRQVTAEFLSSVSDCSFDSIYQALGTQGALYQNSLVSMSEIPRDYDDYLSTSAHMYERLLSNGESLQDFLNKSLVKSKDSTLNINDFEYLRPNLPLLVEYLQKAHQDRKSGVNILLYGPPGTGKSELSRVIAKALGADLFEVPVTDEDNDPIEDRMSCLLLNLAQLKNSKTAMLVFDEAQDLFRNYDAWDFFFPAQSSKENNKKGMTNKILETNAIPVIWITNSISNMDPAYIRRFDFCMEVPVPPESQRKKIIENKASDLLFVEGIEAIAERSDIAPALIDRTAKVISEIKAPKEELQKHFFTHLNASLSTMGVKPVHLKLGVDPNALYDPALSTADTDLLQIAQGIKKTSSARLCLYGVPGTGKTAWARYLGKVLDKRVIVKRYSDLLNCYVGMTEKLIAQAFQEAKADEAIFVLDEADSFLQKRSAADHSWEVTQVNEMLTQIEHFDGIFIATTNALDSMDEACLRRFDLKVKFDYLNADKAKTLFLLFCEKLCPDSTIDDHVLKALEGLRNLAPGDFATLSHQSRFNPINTPEDLLRGLEKECNSKTAHTNKRPIGFS